MANWKNHSVGKHGGTFLVEFKDSSPQPTTAFLSWSRPFSPDDPDDDSREVVMLGYVEGPWESRDAAILATMIEAERLLAEAGYPC
jgi:hypothetical protein